MKAYIKYFKEDSGIDSQLIEIISDFELALEHIQLAFNLKSINECTYVNSINLLAEDIDTPEKHLKKAIQIFDDCDKKLRKIKTTYSIGKSALISTENETWNELLFIRKRIGSYNGTITNINYMPSEGESWFKIKENNIPLFDLLKIIKKDISLQHRIKLIPLYNDIYKKATDMWADAEAIYEVLTLLFKRK